jgi:hypothetical protein
LGGVYAKTKKQETFFPLRQQEEVGLVLDRAVVGSYLVDEGYMNI